MFRQLIAAPDTLLEYAVPPKPPRRRVVSPSLDKPVLLLLAGYEVVSRLRAEGCPLYFGSDLDPATGLDPTDLMRRLGQWTDAAQRAAPPGAVATCWHPAVTADVLRQASRYPVHVLRIESPEDAQAIVRAFCAEHQFPAASTDDTALPA
jgi:hypothetical protein